MAGESARESARRQREKALRLQRSAELWEKGAEGEQRTAEALTSLPEQAWTVFHDLRWPGRRFANVDHVVVGLSGVYVVDSKNWTGTIAVRDGVLRSNGYSRERQVSDVAEAALAVARLTPLLRPDLVKPVLCFVRDEPIKAWARDVMLTSTSTLVQMLMSRTPVLSPEQVRHLCLDLDAGIRSAQHPSPELLPPRPLPRAVGAPARSRSRSASPPRVEPVRVATRKRPPIAGILILIAALGVLSSPGAQAGIGELIVSIFTSDLAEGQTSDDLREAPERCQQDEPPPRCERKPDR